MKISKAMYVLVFIPVLLQAQLLTWQDLTSVSGYATIVRGSGDRLFSTSQSQSAYVSSDDGFTWSPVLSYPSRVVLTQLAVNGSTLAADVQDFTVAARYQIFLSQDNGATWRRIWASAGGFLQNLMIDDSGFVFGVEPTGGVLYWYSGSRWTQISSPQSFLRQDFVPPGVLNPQLLISSAISHSGAILIGTWANGMYISNDRGTTWQHSLFSTSTGYSISAIDASLPDRIILGASPNSTGRTNGGVFVSADSGKSWQGIGLTGLSITSIVPAGAGELYALGSNQVHKYRASTGLWQAIDLGGKQFTALAITSENTVLASSDFQSVLRSTDDGRSWSGGELRGNDAFAITSNDEGDILVGTLGNRVYRSPADGLRWTQSAPGVIGDDVFSFARRNGSVYAGTDLGVYESRDGGSSWNHLTDSSFGGSAFAVGLTSDGTIFAGTSFGVVRSTDGGSTWAQDGIAGSKVFFMCVSIGDVIYAATGQDGVFSSTNQGTSWKSLSLVRDDLQTIGVDSAGDVFTGAYGGVYRLRSGAGAWEYKPFTGGYVYALAFPGSQTIYAGTYNGIYVSYDNGDTWRPAGTSGLKENLMLSLEVTGAGNLLAGTYRGGVYRSVQTVTPLRADGVASIAGSPEGFQLSQNYPNPFNPATNFRFSIPNRQVVTLSVYNVLGQEVARLADGVKGPGEYTVSWDATNLPGGTYFYRLDAAGAGNPGKPVSQVRKMVLIR